MTSAQASDDSHMAVFRIGRFAVPPAAMPAFMERIQQARALLAAQPSCLKRSGILLRHLIHLGNRKVDLLDTSALFN